MNEHARVKTDLGLKLVVVPRSFSRGWVQRGADRVQAEGITQICFLRLVPWSIALL